MKVKNAIQVALIIPTLLLVGCETFNVPTSTSTPRTITLEAGEHGTHTYTEEEYGPFETWVCRARFSSDETILLEVGRMNNPYESAEPHLGFVLYDGTSTGVVARPRRNGLELRWDWEDELGNYSFIIEPDGTGSYYDFTNVGKGQSTQASSTFECTPRE